MKKLAGLIIILIVLILGAYYGMGIFTEKAIKKNMANLNQNKGLTSELGPYHRGWFTSKTEIKWDLQVPARIIKDAEGKPQIIPAQNYKLTMPLTIYHGPLIIADKKVLFGMGYATTQLPLPESYSQTFDAMFTSDSVKPQLDLSIFVNYLRKTTFDLNIPEFKLKSKDGNTQMDWKSLTSTTSVSSGEKDLDGDVILKGVTLNKNDSKLTVQDAKIDYDLHKNDNGLYLGNVKFSLPSLTVEEKGKKIFAINDLKMGSESDMDTNLFSTHFSVSLQSIFAEDKTYGPGNLEISLRNIDADVLARLNEQSKAMQNSSDAEQKKILFSMLPDVPKLFTKGAELEVSQLQLKLPQGQVQGNLLITIPKTENINLFDLFQKIQGKAKLRLPKEVVKTLMHQSMMQQLAKQPDLQQNLIQQLQTQSSIPAINQPALSQEQIATMHTDKQLAALEQAGLIVVQGTDYSVELNLDQGKFTVNGKPYDQAFPIKF